MLIHDAARPLVSPAVIAGCVAALRQHDAVGTAVPSSDTILHVAGGVITDVPPREILYRAQTPQGFRLSVIAEAHRRAAADPDFVATDDCSVVLRYLPDVPVHVVPGSESNIKVTYPGDLAVAEALLSLDRDYRLARGANLSPGGKPRPGRAGSAASATLARRTRTAPSRPRFSPRRSPPSRGEPPLSPPPAPGPRPAEPRAGRAAGVTRLAGGGRGHVEEPQHRGQQAARQRISGCRRTPPPARGRCSRGRVTTRRSSAPSRGPHCPAAARPGRAARGTGPAAPAPSARSGPGH